MNGRPRFTVPSQVPSGDYMAEAHLERIPTAFESFAQTALANIKAARAQKAEQTWEREKAKTEFLHQAALANLGGEIRRKTQEEAIRLEPKVKGEFLQKEREAEYGSLVDLYEMAGVPEETAREMAAKRIYLSGGGYYGSQAWEPPTKPAARGGKAGGGAKEFSQYQTAVSKRDAVRTEMRDLLKNSGFPFSETKIIQGVMDLSSPDAIAQYVQQSASALSPEALDFLRDMIATRQMEFLAQDQTIQTLWSEYYKNPLPEVPPGKVQPTPSTASPYEDRLRRNVIEFLEGTKEEPEGEIYLPE